MFWDLLSTFVSTVGEIQEGQADAKAANYNKNIERFNAQALQQTGVVEEARVRREGTRRAGLIRANVGASGFDMSGSAYDILSESIMESEIDAMSTRQNYGNQAKSALMRAELYKAKGADAKRASYIRASSQITRGAAKIYEDEADTTAGKPFRI